MVHVGFCWQVWEEKARGVRSALGAVEMHGSGVGWWQQEQVGGGWRATPHMTDTPTTNSHTFTRLTFHLHLEPVSPSTGVFRWPFILEDNKPCAHDDNGHATGELCHLK